jgi:predicted RNA binding protein YcfA (HicA-like mRNA interferase family)
MSRFPGDAPKTKVLKALESLGFEIIREREHIAMQRRNADGSYTPLTMPTHPTYKSSTLRTILAQVGIPRDSFLTTYHAQ